MVRFVICLGLAAKPRCTPTIKGFAMSRLRFLTPVLTASYLLMFVFWLPAEAVAAVQNRV